MIFTHNNPHLWVQTTFMSFWFYSVASNRLVCLIATTRSEHCHLTAHLATQTKLSRFSKNLLQIGFICQQSICPEFRDLLYLIQCYGPSLWTYPGVIFCSNYKSLRLEKTFLFCFFCRSPTARSPGRGQGKMGTAPLQVKAVQKYSGDPKTGHIWFLIGQQQAGCEIVSCFGMVNQHKPFYIYAIPSNFAI